jgi:hypothetical protein
MRPHKHVDECLALFGERHEYDSQGQWVGYVDKGIDETVADAMKRLIEQSVLCLPTKTLRKLIPNGVASILRTIDEIVAANTQGCCEIKAENNRVRISMPAIFNLLLGAAEKSIETRYVPNTGDWCRHIDNELRIRLMESATPNARALQ